MKPLFNAAAFAALIAAPTFGAASTPSFEESLKAAEQTANGKEALRECLKSVNTDVIRELTGVTAAEYAAAPDYLKEPIEKNIDRATDLTLEAVDQMGGDYTTAAREIVLFMVRDGTLDAASGKAMHDGFIACFEADQ